MLTTTDGLAALIVLVIFPLLLIAFAIWMELSRSSGTRGGAVEMVVGEAVRTLLLVVLLSILPSLVNGLSSIIQLGFRPDGGGWFVFPNLTFLIGPLAWLTIVALVVRRVIAINRWLKILRG
ncbi:photosynthetic reaction center M subunit [Ahrensia sp. R2A130]|nr:photosynthetic reaction center M subunit [Ahrensia sp. R2A130]